jgi:HlyD family secretion protein
MIVRTIVTLSALPLVLVAAACKDTEEGRPFQVVAAQRQTLAISAEAAGVLEPVTTVEIKSKASGAILSIAVESGDLVEQGALLVQVEKTDARQTLAQARADLEVAKARLKIASSQLERAERMREQQIISDQDFEQAELEHANAKAQLVRAESMLETARKRMSDTTIRAPFSGTIIDRTVEVGNVISSATQVVGGGTLLMVMADLNEVQVRTLVDETDIGRVQPDMPADIQVEAYRDRSFPGRVLKIEPQATVTQNVTMFPVIIRIRNEEGLLKPGMSAEVTIQVARSENTITVPTQAVHPPDDALEVAQLALGIDAETFRQMLAENTPQAAGTDGGPGGAGSNGQRMPRFTQAQRDSIRERFRSGEMTPDETRHTRAMGQRMRQAREQQTRAGGPREGVVFAMRDGRLVPVSVRIGVTDWEDIEVVSGLQEGDSIALLPTASLLRDQAQLLERFQRFRGSGVPGMRTQGS